ncbi:MAG TPA: hypothetical protein VMP00_05335 [Burkholderiales bacterium]|nr:hypothetical protein [Burkholderiales bacterium]
MRHPDYSWSPFFLPENEDPVATLHKPPVYQSRFVSSSVDDVTHSASLAPLPDGGLFSVWFAGSREGSPSVEIRGARFDPHAGE